MLNTILACYFVCRGIRHFIDDNDMVWWDIFMVIFNLVLAQI